MTDDEANYYIALAILHAPSTIEEQGPHDIQDPFIHSKSTGLWWIYRNGPQYKPDQPILPVSFPDFATKGEAAKHYCEVYGLLPEVTDENN